MDETRPTESSRVTDTMSIAGYGIGLAAIIVFFGRFLVAWLPLIILLCTAYAIFCVWRSGGRSDRSDAAELEALRDKVRELEERLESAEVVDAFEERLAAKEAELRVKSMTSK